ncbi:MAG: MFS transporter, partial [Verrucomicrobiaceae bacterium]
MSMSAERPWPSAFFGWAWVVLLFIVFACSFIDRQILSLMVGPIKADLGITDSQFSLLHG